MEKPTPLPFAPSGMLMPSSPLGAILITASPLGLTGLSITTNASETQRAASATARNTLLVEAARQLTAYFDGVLREFTLPIDWSGMPDFQEQVLRCIQRIPYGQTRAYGEIARALGSPTGSRAVGSALAAHPIPIILPCHRVVGADNSLRGFSAPGGVSAKAWLLALEGARLL